MKRASSQCSLLSCEENLRDLCSAANCVQHNQHCKCYRDCHECQSLPPIDFSFVLHAVRRFKWFLPS
jgi:hypothetical protein